jgi:hypothetical protein
MVITHEHGVQIIFLGLHSLALIWLNFHEFWIINYELIIKYQSLTIKSIINN